AVRIRPAPPASLQFSGFSSSLPEKRAFGRNPVPKSTGEPVSSGSNASFEGFSLFALWAVDLARRSASADRLLTFAGSRLHHPGRQFEFVFGLPVSQARLA